MYEQGIRLGDGDEAAFGDALEISVITTQHRFVSFKGFDIPDFQ